MHYPRLGGLAELFDAFQGMEWVILFLIVLLIFGPSKLPQLAKGLGQAVYEFRKASQGLVEEPPSKPAMESSGKPSQEEILRLLAERLAADEKEKAEDDQKRFIETADSREASDRGETVLVEVKTESKTR